MTRTVWTGVARGRLELVLTGLVVVWLVWLARGFGEQSWLSGADDRYQRDLALAIELPPELQSSDWTRRTCRELGTTLPKITCETRRTALGRIKAIWFDPPAAATPAPTAEAVRDRVAALLASFNGAHEALLNRFSAPLAKLDTEPPGAADGFVDDDWESSVKRAREQTRVYREAYGLVLRGHQAIPLPLDCAWRYLTRLARQPSHPPDDRQAALAVAGLAAILDGAGARLSSGTFPADRSWSADEVGFGCKGSKLAAAVEAASIVGKARSSAGNAAKAAAVQDMLPRAGWQLAIWAAGGLLILTLGRAGGSLKRMLFVALLTWAVIAAVAPPHLEWLGGGRVNWFSGRWVLPIVLLLTACASLYLPGSAITSPAVPSSAVGYPCFVLFVGIGWWLLLDLSAFGHFDNRFQGLYQQTYIFAAFLIIVLGSLGRSLFATQGLRLLSFWPLVAAGQTPRAVIAWGLASGLALLALIGTTALLSGQPQLSSEIFRGCLLVGGAWFLLARGETWLSPWLRAGEQESGAQSRRPGMWQLLSLRLKLAAPLFPLAIFVLGGLILTRDNGPLLVILNTGALLVGLVVTVHVAGRFGWVLAVLSGFTTIALWIWGLATLLLRFGGALGGRIAERVESAEQPFLAGNDQMAHVLWFQEAASEVGGFGFGGVPWCGDIPGGCRGVPAQIQSDYIFTALYGVFGPAAWLLLAIFGLWLWRLARSHPTATSGKVDADDPGQAWLSWLTLIWVGLTLAQTAITTAGNLCWLPLTGITFPFMSFGSWSLLANAAFLSLALHLNRRADDH